jgi:hypothetical protein
MRRRPEEAFGSRFDIRAFHDVVLGDRSLPVAVYVAQNGALRGPSRRRRWSVDRDPQSPHIASIRWTSPG